MRVQSIAGTVYLLAHREFDATRVMVRETESGRVYLLDLSATGKGGSGTPVEVYAPRNPGSGRSKQALKAASAPAIPSYGYVTLTRFAAQQLYAPARLLRDLPGVVRVPVKRKPVALLRGAAVTAEPLVAWRAGDLYLTAVKLTNRTDRALTLDPRTLRGDWLSAAFQHNRLLPKRRRGRHHGPVPDLRAAVRGLAVRTHAMAVATSNRLLPILAGAVLLMLVFVTLKSCSDDGGDGFVMDRVPEAPAPDADTPADTIKTLTANVAAMTTEVEALRQDNTGLRRENQALLRNRTQIEENVREPDLAS